MLIFYELLESITEIACLSSTIMALTQLFSLFLSPDRQQAWGRHPERFGKRAGPAFRQPPPRPRGAFESSARPRGRRSSRSRRGNRNGERVQSHRVPHGLYDRVLWWGESPQAPILLVFPDCTPVRGRGRWGRTVSAASVSPQSVQHLHLRYYSLRAR